MPASILPASIHPASPAPAPLQPGPVAAGAETDLCVTPSPFVSPLFVPGNSGLWGRLRLPSSPLMLSAQASEDALAFAATSGGYRFLNPTIVAAPGDDARIFLSNRLSESTVAHWHGLTVDTRNDGNGEALIEPGGRFDYAFRIQNRAGLYWYHPHPHGATAAQVYRGLFGLIEVEDEEDLALRRSLDLVPGATELTLILQDRRSGGPAYAPTSQDMLFGWYGDQPQVNGSHRPHHDVAGRRHRLRILNASNARSYLLAFRRDDGSPITFHLIGTDGGLLARAVPCRQVFISPAERIDLLVDFSAIAQGGFVTLESAAFDPMHAVSAAQAARAAGSAAVAHSHGPSRDTPESASGTPIPDGSPCTLMQFRIREAGEPGRPLPVRLSSLPEIDADDYATTRAWRLGFAKGRWRINDRFYEMDGAAIEVARGSRETWLLRNYHTSAPHAMHLHGFQFRVLERETSPDQLASLVVDSSGRLATDLGSKDTVLVWPGESVRIAIDFSHPFAGEQLYLLHCHNLEHEDGGMMMRVAVR